MRAEKKEAQSLATGQKWLLSAQYNLQTCEIRFQLDYDLRPVGSSGTLGMGLSLGVTFVAVAGIKFGPAMSALKCNS